MAKISFITIGSELLKGQIVNTNAAEVGKLLRKSGFDLQRVVTIGDTESAIRQAVETELVHHDVVLVSGGLGPTRDDITKYTLADIFGGEWNWDEEVLAHLVYRYQVAGRELNELTRQQAYLPSSSKTVPNRYGTAPGMHFERAGKHLFAMPGVPYEMLYMMEAEVVPRILQYFSTDTYLTHVFRLANVSESDVAEQIHALDSQWPKAVQVAYLPRMDGLWLELQRVHSAQSAEQAQAEMTLAQSLVRSQLANKTYTEGVAPIGQVVQAAFRGHEMTLGIAESMTGGHLSAKIVSESGASHFFKGSVTAYDAALKTRLLDVPASLIQEKGVVSEEVAIAMAEGVRSYLGTDVGIATTGLAESSGDESAKVWLACASKHGTYTRLANLRYQRSINIERAANYALQLCLTTVFPNS